MQIENYIIKIKIMLDKSILEDSKYKVNISFIEKELDEKINNKNDLKSLIINKI